MPAFPLSARRLTFYALTLLLAYIAATRLAFVFQHLWAGSALDLGSRAVAVERWFSGQELYAYQSSTYPPASYVLLWPLLGWLSLAHASWLWTLLYAATLGWMATLCARHQAIASHSARWFAAMVFLSLTATSAAVWLGQLVPLSMAAIVGAMFLLHPPPDQKLGWQREVLAGALLLFALAKPSVAAPFLWLVLWKPMRLRLGLGVIVGYAILTLVALWFQHNATHEVTLWAQTVNRDGAHLSEGYANLRAWAEALGIKQWSNPLSLVIWLWLGYWTYRHRHLDRLLLLSITALVARLWTYHNIYDDMLLAIPMLLLLQIALNAAPSAQRVCARGLVITFVALMILPPNWFFEQSLPGLAARTLMAGAMVLSLLFLVWIARAENLAIQSALNESLIAKQNSKISEENHFGEKGSAISF